MKKTLRFLIWFVIVMAVLLVALYFTARTLINRPKVKDALTGAIERTTGRKASYDRIDIRLFPISLVLRDPVFMEKDGQNAFVSLHELSAVISLARKEMVEMIIDSPTIRIVQHADGTFNFSDLLPVAETETPTTSTTAGTSRPVEPAVPATAEKESATPPEFLVKLLQIKNAQFDYIQEQDDGTSAQLQISDLDFNLHEFSLDRPFHMDGRAAIGKTSSVSFQFTGAALNEAAQNPAAYALDLKARADIADFADIQMFLPEDTLPFKSLTADLTVQGSLAGGLATVLTLQTPEPTDAYPVAIRGSIRPTVSLPAAILQHLVFGTPVPDELMVYARPCELPPGSITLQGDAATRLLLTHLNLSTDVDFPLIAYGKNRFTDFRAGATLQKAAFASSGSLAAYGGSLSFEAGVDTLGCPLRYRLNSLTATNLAIEQVLAANDLPMADSLSGKVNLQGSLYGFAIEESAFDRGLNADFNLHVTQVQTTGSGGSLLDQVWLKLDNPILLNLAPNLQEKVDAARIAADNTTTTHYDDVTASISLANGTATLSNTRMALPDYTFEMDGTIKPFADQMNLNARLLVSAAETDRLTGGKDRSTYLPYQDGGLLVPFVIQGSMEKPSILPDLDIILRNAASGAIQKELVPHLEKLSDSDRKHVQQGLEVLQGLGGLFK